LIALVALALIAQRALPLARPCSVWSRLPSAEATFASLLAAFASLLP
jgi:hypothetical protein